MEIEGAAGADRELGERQAEPSHILAWFRDRPESLGTARAAPNAVGVAYSMAWT
jgi:hypothetical protein